MSTHSCPVVVLPRFGKHPNADSLSIVNLFGPVIFKTGDFQEGELVAYIPLDSVLPDTPEYGWMDSSSRKRLRAKKLRGTFSMGLLVKAPEGLKAGDDASSALGITKWEPPPLSAHLQGDMEPDPGWGPVYDVENYRRYPYVLQPGELVNITEKLHGCNARFAHVDGKLWVGSHRTWKKDAPGVLWWDAFRNNKLEEALRSTKDLILYGEVYGEGVQDLAYGQKPPAVRFFDVFDITTRRYFSPVGGELQCASIGLKWVPTMRRAAPWDPALLELANGNSTIYGGHIMEGIVIRPVKERLDPEIGRAILKHVSEKYLLRKEGTEAH